MTDHHASSARAALWSSRLLVMLVLVAGVVAGVAMLAVLTGEWWGLAAAMIVLLAAAFLVVRNVLSLLADVDAPSPTERARLEAQGVLDPDRRLNEQRSDGDGGRARRIFREDSGDAASTEEQQSAWTPTPSRRVE
jgi:ABC-type nickel/cobalt efflux system permease component RcnA